METDPFTLVYVALWNMLEQSSEFCNLVPARNRIKFTTRDRDPVKNEVSSRDLPEVRIIPSACVPHVQRTSSSSTCLEKFDIQISSGDNRLSEVAFPLKWAIYRAFRNWAVVLSALTWNAKSFVRIARPEQIETGTSEADQQRGIGGWASVWSCEVELWFTTTDL